MAYAVYACRFPIGKTEQVKKWPGDALRSFWGKWYFPANATLYVVGDLDRDVEATRELIKNTFGKLPAAVQLPETVQLPEAVQIPEAVQLSESSNGHGNNKHLPSTLIKQRHDVRPPVQHK